MPLVTKTPRRKRGLIILHLPHHFLTLETHLLSQIQTGSQAFCKPVCRQTLAFFRLLCYTTEEGQRDLVSPGGTEMMSSQQARIRHESRCPSPPGFEPRTIYCTFASCSHDLCCHSRKCLGSGLPLDELWMHSKVPAAPRPGPRA
jgi:hypothetical protein